MLAGLFADREIKVHVQKILESKAGSLRGKVAIDAPAGSGHSSQILKDLGAEVVPFDLFPENFKVEGLQCLPADLEQGLNYPDGAADLVLFQEGIEHLPDQLKVLRDLGRCLKIGGSLIVTTPNYSNMRARLSYFLNESEYYKYMPPNEVESIWWSGGDYRRVYMGHVFMLGVQKLRLFSQLSGLRVAKIYPSKFSFTAFLLMVLFYPFVLLTNMYAFMRALRKNRGSGRRARKVFSEQFLLGISPSILCSTHLIVEFEKMNTWEDGLRRLYGKLNDGEIHKADFVS